jgi:hypothetical protein
MSPLPVNEKKLQPAQARCLVYVGCTGKMPGLRGCFLPITTNLEALSKLSIPDLF